MGSASSAVKHAAEAVGGGIKDAAVDVGHFAEENPV